MATRTHNYVMNEKVVQHSWDAAKQAFYIRFLAPKENPELTPNVAFESWSLWFTPDEWEGLLSVWGEPFTVAGSKVPVKARLWFPAVLTVSDWLRLPYETQVATARQAMQNGHRVRPWTLGSVEVMIDEAEERAGLGKPVLTAAAPIGPRKPVPALPAESNTLYSVFKPFNPACAWNATRIAAGDPPRE